MNNRKCVRDFAVKWLDKFRDENADYKEIVDHHMADECEALGFKMDGGSAFEEMYGAAICDSNELDKIIEDVNDIQLLGSAIYSGWRYFNHWVFDPASILEQHNRSWFITALNRLLYLATYTSMSFKGKLKKMRLVSNALSFRQMPKPEDEVEQHLTINENGRVWFSSYIFGEKEDRFTKTRSMNFSINKDDANEILNMLEEYFKGNPVLDHGEEHGIWELELTNTENELFRYQGSIGKDIVCRGIRLSDFIRQMLDICELTAFDGRWRTDVIRRITVEYNRVTKYNNIDWDYRENLIIDRGTETIEHVQKIGTNCRITRKYEIGGGGIKSFLDFFNAEEMFAYVQGSPSDEIPTPEEKRDYVITVDYKNASQRRIEGSYDKNGLPYDYSYFMENLINFLNFYGIGDIFNYDIYGKAKRCKSDYIFCSVVFSNGTGSYYYMTDDDSISIGDYVIVPTGNNEYETVVKVVDKEYFSKDSAPIPVSKAKCIIRKYNDKRLMS